MTTDDNLGETKMFSFDRAVTKSTDYIFKSIISWLRLPDSLDSDDAAGHDEHIVVVAVCWDHGG